MKKLIFLVLISTSIQAQKVYLFDKNNKRITKEPIELDSIPDRYDYLPDGIYKIQQWRLIEVNGEPKYEVIECDYRKVTTTLMIL